ncbi:MAG: hypothetical protein M1500_00705 [Candidatus Marsarchaeota archaeon]|nr:hypothetical protein [Candidatus Marsarchaeota archaeon]MCL5112223.1 hypothetical protein [Candidatus Marsarchaeota archaeon]
MEYMPLTDVIRTLLLMARAAKGQGSIEYVMMLSAVSIVIVIALAMMTQLKGAAIHAMVNGTNSSVMTELTHQLSNLSS